MHYARIVSFHLILIHNMAASTDWCSDSLDCRRGGMKYKNTMCTYQQQTSSTFCRNIKDSNTPDKRKEILDAHNEYRNMFAKGEKGWPRAANMRQMTWDADLEEVALRWAVQCKEGHDTCRSTPKFPDVGQNYAMQANPRSSPDSSSSSFKGWVNEINEATPALVDRFHGGFWGHFTQVIWADSYKLGCAQIQFQQQPWYKTVLICNYGPAGNFLSQPIYKKGDPCTQCPPGTSCRENSAYPKLCALPSDPIESQRIQRGYNKNSGTSLQNKSENILRRQAIVLTLAHLAVTRKILTL